MGARCNGRLVVRRLVADQIVEIERLVLRGDPLGPRRGAAAAALVDRQLQFADQPLDLLPGRTASTLAAWLRPGTVHASCGAADVLADIVAQIRLVWPDVRITVRGDTGLAVPEMYTFCETHDVRCQVRSISGFSAHADESEILEWLAHFKEGKKPGEAGYPRRIFLVHGDPTAEAAIEPKILRGIAGSFFNATRCDSGYPLTSCPSWIPFSGERPPCSLVLYGRSIQVVWHP